VIVRHHRLYAGGFSTSAYKRRGQAGRDTTGFTPVENQFQPLAEDIESLPTGSGGV